ncbi:Retrotransposon Polyprotein, partial [Phytophthora megakarya]
MRLNDVPFTASQTLDGLFEYLAVPIGFNNAPATLNRIVQAIFEDMRHFVATYSDDVFVFERCKENLLYLKLAKSTLCSEGIPCLGDFVGRHGVRIGPNKVRVIRNWLQPQTAKELQSILGTTIKNKDKISLTWSPESCKAFEQLNKHLVKHQYWRYQILINRSSYARTRHVQEPTSKRNEVEQPIAFCGRKLNSAELKYPIHEQEMLAIIHCLKIWRVYLVDGGCPVKTDHHSLERVLTQKTIHRRYLSMV